MRPSRSLMVLAFRISVACIVAFNWPARAQNENVFRPARGFQPAGSYSVSQIETVNNVTGGVTVRLPLAKVAGRNGAGLSLDLIYNSALFNLQTQQADAAHVMQYSSIVGIVNVNMLNVSDAGGWRYSHRFSLNVDSRGGSTPGTRLTLVAGDGSSHQLWLRVPLASQNSTDGYSQFDITGKRSDGACVDLNGDQVCDPKLIYYATDGSFIRVELTIGSTWVAYFPNGDYVSGPILSTINIVTPKDADKICDRNGNCTLITNTIDPTTQWPATTTISDAFGRQVVITYGGDPNGAGTDQVRALPYGASTTGTWGDPRNQPNPITTSVVWNTIYFGASSGTADAANSGVMYECPAADGSETYTCLNRFSLRMVSQVALPTGLSYDFTYADNTAGAETAQGELRQIKLPTKTGEAARAEVHYYWSRKERPVVGSSPTPWFDANINPVSKKTVQYQEESDAGAVATNCSTGVGCETWNYQFGTIDGSGNFSSFGDHSIATAPDGGVTTQYFYTRGGLVWNSGLVFKTTGPAGNTWRCWQSNEPWIGVSALSDPKNPYVRAEYRQLPGATSAAATGFDYDKNGNLVTKREYDWVPVPGTEASCSVSGTTLRKTENRYWSPAGGTSLSHAADAPTIGLANAYWDPGAKRKRDSVLETRLYAGESTTAAVSQFQYDDPDSAGNVRYIYQWDNQLQTTVPTVPTSSVTLSSTNASVTERQYGIGFGILTKEIDPSGNAVQRDYGAVQNCPAVISNIYPTLITSPEGQITQYNYDCATGATTDEIVTSNRNLRTHYDYDRYGRITATTSGYGLSAPNSRTTTTEYNDQARQVRVVNDGLLGQVSYFNQIGGLFRESENADDATAAISSGSTHDIRTVSIDRTVPTGSSYSLSSNPYLSDGSTSDPALGWTLRRADTTGRTADIYYYRGSAKPAPFGNNANSPTHESYSYSGVTTTSTDPQGKSRTTTVDALGRLKTASDGGLSAATYGYDALDNLTSVTMTDSVAYGSTKTQTRLFVYSSLGRLVSATNPENGTTSYTYYRNGAVHTKTDARGVVITFTVDGLGRVTKKDYTATTPATPVVRLCYDGKIYAIGSDSCVADSGRVADYAQGALTHAVTRNGSTIVSETKYTGIDAQGRVTASIQKTPGLADSALAYQYSSTGQLAAVQYPSGRWISYDINGANRVKAVRKGQTGTSYYLQNATYKPDGSFAGAVIGLDLTSQWSDTRQYNSRLQPCMMQIQKGIQTTLLSLQWKHSVNDPDGQCEGAVTDNNGNLMAERLQYPSGGSQQTVLRSYGYDNANRVSSYSEPSKSQSYGYDAFGNMWQSGTASGVPELRPNGPSWYLVNNQVTNRLNSTVYDAGGYEAQLTVANGGTNAFFDAEGRLVQVVLGAVAATYVYDAEDRRVKRTDSGGNATYYVYNAEGQVMAEYAAAPSASGTQYVSTDFLGSMRMLQDSLGNCIMRLDYAPYGAVVPRSGQDCYTTAAWNGPLFAGGYRDSATDLDHMGAREYYYTLGRFISPDPENAGADPTTPGSWNMYGYAYNNPLIYIDPTGTCSKVVNGDGSDGGYTDEGDGLFPGSCAGGQIGGTKPHQVTVGVGSEEANLIMLSMVGAALTDSHTVTQFVSDALRATASIIVPGVSAVAECVAGTIIGTGCDKTSLAMAVIPRPPGTSMQRFVKNRKLLNILKAWNRTGTGVGTGSTPDAIREEIRTGVAVGGKFHFQKGEEFRRSLVGLLRDPSLDPKDKAIVKEMLIDLQNALSTQRR